MCETFLSIRNYIKYIIDTEPLFGFKNDFD